MIKRSDVNNEETKSNVETDNKGKSLKGALAGGVVGLAIGCISSEKNRQKLVKAANKEFLKEKGSEVSSKTKSKMNYWKESGMEKSNQALQGVKTSTGNLFSSQKQEDFENLKLEQENMYHRLQSLEEKIDKLLKMNGLNEIDENPERSELEGDKTTNTKSSTNKSKNKKQQSGKTAAEKETAVTSDDDTSS
ncbi:YtxH domain-containing protein [Virgibacillus ihumii]|uniref:YtxH domain-containing protein n=1 Tax=Virgibacillus ihumii TaxID=2686091 RepID=UPI00157E01F5|nr:YtxH domain-containing protein [Virgibacillus ihumii]